MYGRAKPYTRAALGLVPLQWPHAARVPQGPGDPGLVVVALGAGLLGVAALLRVRSLRLAKQVFKLVSPSGGGGLARRFGHLRSKMFRTGGLLYSTSGWEPAALWFG